MQFSQLEPADILDAVEAQMDLGLTNLCRPYSSYINRVFELQAQDGTPLVVKLYRPGRWTEEAILDEHDFLFDLQDEEIPVVAPYALADDTSIGHLELGDEAVLFAVFPKMGGRSYSEFQRSDWIDFGRLLGRVHNVGAQGAAEARVIWTPREATWTAWQWIVSTELMPKTIASEYGKLVRQFLSESAGIFSHTDLQRIHGDCHRSNILCRPETGMFLIDFDDMATGPVVQDVWLLLSGDRGEREQELSWFQEGYNVFNTFPQGQLHLIEPLRAMRYVHFMAWNARQYLEDGVAHVSDRFNTAVYWEEQLTDFRQQVARCARI